jgi:hypothetical protein
MRSKKGPELQKRGKVESSDCISCYGNIERAWLSVDH